MAFFKHHHFGPFWRVYLRRQKSRSRPDAARVERGGVTVAANAAQYVPDFSGAADTARRDKADRRRQ
jgi:hypothetical protein